jgi:phosphonopyruvate decarboxylase
MVCLIDIKQFGNELKNRGFLFYSGVPCSYLKPFINFAINECEYVAAVNEGEAVAIASGAHLGGTKPVVLMQNSGLANAMAPLISLNTPFQLPVLGFVSLRGEKGVPDEPQHEVMGEITAAMLELIGVQWELLSFDLEEAKQQLSRAEECLEHNRSFFFIVRKGTFSPEQHHEKNRVQTNNHLKVLQQKVDELPARYEALTVINSLKDQQTVQLATTGKTGRELYEIEDGRNNLYMVGSMGCVSSIGLGLSMTQHKLDIIAIDGDGALLMRMGNLATNGYYSPANLLHILLDNHSHDSTGGQRTVSDNVNFVEIAASCGYAKSIYVHNLAELAETIQQWKKTRGLTFLYLKIRQGSKEKLGRPKLKPHEVTERLKGFIYG